MGLTLLEIQSLTASLAANGRVPSTVPAPAASGTVTGIIPAAGTTPTAGSGFTYTHTNGTGIYVFTFSIAFSAAPVVLMTQTANPLSTATTVGAVESVSTSGFTVRLQSTAGTPADNSFNFTAQAVA